MEEISIPQEGHILIGKSGEGGESSAKTNSQKNPPFIIDQIRPFGDPKYQANQQTTHNIDHHRPIGKSRGNAVLHRSRRKISGNTPDKTSDTYVKQSFKHERR